jgi:hypothetical protein
MARKFTLNQVRLIFEAGGLELRSTKYMSSKKPLWYHCKQCGRANRTRLEYVQNGNGCPHCWEARRCQSHKHSFGFIREKFAAKDLKLLGATYANSKTPLAYECLKCGYEGQIRFNDLRNGSGCRSCGINRRSSSRKLDFAAFKNDMFKRQIEVISKEYPNSSARLQLRCIECGCAWRATANDLRNTGTGCPRCGHKRGGRKLALKTDQVSQRLDSLGMILLSGYKTSQRPVRVRFNTCGHEVERTYNQLSQLPRCGMCAPNARPTEKDYDSTANTFGGKILKIANRVSQNSLWLCPLGKHRFERSLESIRACKTFCTVCNRAYGEMLCRAAVEKLFGMTFRSKRPLGMRSPKGRLLELDIYNAELRIAVEHHGAQHYRAMPHWHGEEGFQRQLLHDQKRREFCQKNGILLIEIREILTHTSLEEMREKIRNALLNCGRPIPPGFETADLTRLPQLSSSQGYWADVHEAARKINLKILSKVFLGADTPLDVICNHGHSIKKTPRSILQSHKCHECYMDQLKKPVQLSDGRVFESGTAAAKVLGVIKETINTAVRNEWKVKGFSVKRISWNEFLSVQPFADKRPA